MAKLEHYDIGDLWTPQMTWKIDSNNDGIPDAVTDPSQIVIRQKTPGGVESVLTTASSPSTLTTASTPLARLSQGVFRLNPGVTLNAAGYWFIRAEGTGAAEASEEFEAVVDPSEFTADAGISSRALVGLAETKDWLQQQNVATAEDLELVRVINDVSDRIYYESGGREFVARDSGTTRTFDVDLYGYCLYIDDLAVLTTASPAVTISNRYGTAIKTLNNADVTTYPLNREPWEPITKLEFLMTTSPTLYPGARVAVTGTWGFPSVPGNIRQAALDTIAAIMDRDVEHYRQDLGEVTGEGGGNTVVLQSPQQMFITLPPSAFAAVRMYKKPLLGY